MNYKLVLILAIIGMILATSTVSACLLFNDPTTWDQNGNGIPDVESYNVLSYRIVEDTSLCYGQTFIQLIVDEDISVTCGAVKSRGELKSNPMYGHAVIIMQENSTMQECTIVSLYENQSTILVNGSNVKLIGNTFSKFAVYINNTNAHVVGNSFLETYGVSVNDYGSALIFDNRFSGLNSLEMNNGYAHFSCNAVDTTNGVIIENGYAVVEYNTITSTNAVQVSGGMGDILYNNILSSIHGLVASGSSDHPEIYDYEVIGNSVLNRYGTTSIDWTGIDAYFMDNAFCSGSVSADGEWGTGNYCDYSLDCTSCELYDERYTELVCPYSYNGELLEAYIGEPDDYDYTEFLPTYIYTRPIYVKEIYTTDNLTVHANNLENRRYSRLGAIGLFNGIPVDEDDPLFSFNKAQEVVDLDSSEVDYYYTYNSEYTRKGNEYFGLIWFPKLYTTLDSQFILMKFIVLNSPPENITLHPANESTFLPDHISVWAEADDADGDELNFEYHVIYPDGLELLSNDDIYTEFYGPGTYEWYVIVSDGEAYVESVHYFFTVNRTSGIDEIIFEPVGSGAVYDRVDTIDDLICSVKPSGVFDLDYEYVQFKFFVNDVEVYSELSYDYADGWFSSTLDFSHTQKDDVVECRAYTIWDESNYDSDEIVSAFLTIENTPPTIDGMLPENHTSVNDYLEEGIISFLAETSDIDADEVICTLYISEYIEGRSLPDPEEFYSEDCEWDIDMEYGRYIWYVVATDGDDDTTSELRYLNIGPRTPYIESVDLIQVNGVREYWETYDDMLVNINFNPYSSTTVALLFIGVNCTLEDSGFVCDSELVNTSLPCGTGNCEYVLDNIYTNKHDNLTVYVEGLTQGIWEVPSLNNFTGYVYINNIPPEFEEFYPLNNTIMSVYNVVDFEFPAEDLDDTILHYTMYIHKEDIPILSYEGTEPYTSFDLLPYHAGNYTWYVEVTDGEVVVTSEVYHFELVDPYPTGEIEISIYPKPGTGYTDERVETFDDIICEITTEGEADAILFKWFVNEEVVYTEHVPYGDFTRELSHEETSKHDNITCTAQPYNDSPHKMIYWGDLVNDSLSIQNIRPEPPVLIAPPDGSTIRHMPVYLVVEYDDTDPEGDSVTVHYYLKHVLDSEFEEVSDVVVVPVGGYEWYALTFDGEEYSIEPEHWNFLAPSAIIMPLVENLTIEPRPVYPDDNMACSGYIKSLDEEYNVVFVWQVRNNLGEWVNTDYSWSFDLPEGTEWNYYETEPITGMATDELWKCVVLFEGREIDYDTIIIGDVAPTIRLISPENNTLVEPPTTLTWEGYDPGEDDLIYTLYINDEPVYFGSEQEYIFNALDSISVYHWYVTVTDSRSTIESETWMFTTLNFPCPDVYISPDEPTNENNLVCHVSGNVDELVEVFGNVRADIRWYKNGVFSEQGDNLDCTSGSCTSVLDSSFTSPGEIWECKAKYYVRYNDLSYFGCTGNDSVLIYSEIPVIVLIKPEDSENFDFENNNYLIDFEWMGSGILPLNYLLYIDGSQINMADSTTYSTYIAPGTHEWYVIAYDEENYAESEHRTFTVSTIYPCELTVNMQRPTFGREPITVDIDVSPTIRTLSIVWGTPVVANLYCTDGTDFLNEIMDCYDGCEYIISGEHVNTGENWHCSAYLQEDFENYAEMSCSVYDSLTVGNNIDTPPVIDSVEINPVEDGIVCDVIANDLESETLEITVIWYHNNQPGEYLGGSQDCEAGEVCSFNIPVELDEDEECDQWICEAKAFDNRISSDWIRSEPYGSFSEDCECETYYDTNIFNFFVHFRPIGQTSKIYLSDSLGNPDFAGDYYTLYYHNYPVYLNPVPTPYTISSGESLTFADVEYTFYFDFVSETPSWENVVTVCKHGNIEENIPPEIFNVGITPAGMEEGVGCAVLVDDVDNDYVDVNIEWYHNGEHMSEYDEIRTCETNPAEPCIGSGIGIPGPNFDDPCDQWVCEAQAYDGIDYSEIVASNPLGNYNEDECNSEPRPCISECTTLIQPGYYELCNDIDVNSVDELIGGVRCINIASDDVHLNCNEYAIRNLFAPQSWMGIYVYQQDNITLEKCHAENWNYGIMIWSSTNSNIHSNTAENNKQGLTVYAYSNNNIFHNNILTNNELGLVLNRYSYSNDYENNMACGNTLRDIRVIQNEDRSLGNTFQENTCDSVDSEEYNREHYCDYYCTGPEPNTPPSINLVLPENDSSLHLTTDYPDITFEWDGNDAEGDVLSYNLYYACDYEEYNLLYSGIDESYTTSNLDGCRLVQWYVDASDDEYTTTSDEWIFHISYEYPCSQELTYSPNPAYEGRDITVTLAMDSQMTDWYDYWGLSYEGSIFCENHDAEYQLSESVDCTDGTCFIILEDVPLGEMSCSAFVGDDICVANLDFEVLEYTETYLPDLIGVIIHPTLVSEDYITCIPLINYIDYEYVGVSIEWYHNGEYMPEYDEIRTCRADVVTEPCRNDSSTVPNPMGAPCDQWVCKATAFDGEIYSSTKTSSPWGHYNEDECGDEVPEPEPNIPPEVVAIVPENMSHMCTYECEAVDFMWAGYDEDMDEVTYTLYLTTPTDEQSINMGILTEYYAEFCDAGVYEWYVVVDDGTTTTQTEKMYFEIGYLPMIYSINPPEFSLVETGQMIQFEVDNTVGPTSFTFEWDNDGTSPYKNALCEPAVEGEDTLLCHDVPVLPDEPGEHKVRVYFGNPGDYGECYYQNEFTFYIDELPNEAPVVNLIYPANHQSIQCGATVDFEWEVIDEDIVDNRLYINSISRTGEVYDLGESTSFSWTAPENEQSYEWYVVVNDEVNSPVESAPWIFDVVCPDEERAFITTPYPNQLFIQQTSGTDLELNVEWIGEPGTYELCISGTSTKCSDIYGNSGTVTLNNTMGRTYINYEISLNKDSVFQDSVTVTYADELKVISPNVKFIGMQGNKLVCQGNVIAQDERVVGETRTVTVDLFKLYDSPTRIVERKTDTLTVGSEYSYIEVSGENLEPGTYKCNVMHTTLYGGGHSLASATYVIEEGTLQESQIIPIPLSPDTLIPIGIINPNAQTINPTIITPQIINQPLPLPPQAINTAIIQKPNDSKPPFKPPNGNTITPSSSSTSSGGSSSETSSATNPAPIPSKNTIISKAHIRKN
ncbi:right-handed parallel beta-helix repeat-containing protein [Candidatus Micrarchaeota archaeon]|nr:right-handed parallel beta-helix repeat-containing protein [Candidatus Micrarchaeota archaeon]